jgi:DNA-binding NarL/FixJ family response regulator
MTMNGERKVYIALPSELAAAIAHATRRSCVLRANRSGRPAGAGLSHAAPRRHWELVAPRRFGATPIPQASIPTTRQLPAAEPVEGPLSRREVEVVKLVMTGMTNRQIGQELFIAERTVEGHVERIRGKLGVRSRTEAALWAARHGVGEVR